MIQKFIDETRLFEILYYGINFYNIRIHDILVNYINEYIKYEKLNCSDLFSTYENFLRQYSKDTKSFIKNNTYPFFQKGYSFNMSRKQYDVVLLLSTILTQHRYDIMVEIQKQLSLKSSALVIGSGVGIELEIIKNSYQHIDAYDVHIDQFCIEKHKSVNFHEEEFTGKQNKKYDDIYIIELLEHISNPFDLIKKAKESITENGRIIITLAVNIPQFDHIYNFNNYTFFIKKIEEMNMNIEYSRDIRHKHLVSNVKASNIFVVIKNI